MADPLFTDPADWIDEIVVAQIINKTLSTMRTERSRGRFHPPYYRCGNKIRYRRSEVEAWLMTCRRVPAATRLAQAA